MLNKRLEELIAFAEATDLQEVLWEKKGDLVSFRRTAGVDKSPQGPGSVPAGADPSGPAKAPEPLTIKSTMVGTFFRSDSPNRPPMVVEGTLVTGGQPVGAIEAMKIMKDVLSPTPCCIVKALVANGHPVEYGQPLFEIETEPENA